LPKSSPNRPHCTVTSARARCWACRWGGWLLHLLDLDLPQSDKRLLTIVETDGCFTSGLSVATNCWVGRRTMRVEDYGKVAATFVDTATDQAIRIAPSLTARELRRCLRP
jgi:formylmethanofuran dehydrogenase subunit E